jgi:hypothetical protein
MTPAGTMPTLSKWSLLRKMAITLAVSAALIVPFWLYAQPDLVIMLAEQLWACF